MIVPNLRFPGFEGEWERKKLGEIATFSKGKGISKNDIEENGMTECIRYGELYTHYGEVIDEIRSKTNINISNLILSEANDVIIPASGETAIDIATASCVLKSDVVLGGDLNIIKSSNNGVFLSYYLNNKKKMKIASLAQGSSVVHLYSSQLASITLNLPKLEEQNKIAFLLSLLDSRIHTQNKIIEELSALKKGIVQKLFSQDLRFKDENGKKFPNWGKMPLGNLLSEKNTKTTKSNEFPILSSTTKGLFNQSDYFTREVASKDNTGYKILKKKQLVFSPQNLWLGNINVNMNFEIGIVSPSYKIFSFINKYTSAEFCKYLLFTPKLFFEYAQASEQGASVVRRNLDMEAFRSIITNLPSLKEQTKIANFLSSIDSKIDVETQLLQKLEAQKKFLLQNMFV